MRNSILWISILILSLLSLFIGAYSLNIGDVLNGNSESLHVLYYSRIPRLVSVLISGAALSMAGMIMQKIMNTPYVSPSTTVSATGIQMGLTIGFILLGSLSIAQKYLFGMSFSFILTFAFIYATQKIHKNRILLLPLLGIIVNMVIESITSFLAMRYDITQTINSYFMGSFSLLIEGRYEWLYICIPLIIIALWYSKSFHILELGEDFAKGVGVNTTLITNIGLIIICGLLTLVVVNVGVLPFVGLMVPNIVRRGKWKNPFISSMGLGMLLVLVSDILARIIVFPYEISVSLIISCIGSIWFIVFIMKRDKYA